jgi:hypothetical protein
MVGALMAHSFLEIRRGRIDLDQKVEAGHGKRLPFLPSGMIG